MTTVLQYLVIAAVIGLALFGLALLLFGRGEQMAALPARTSPARLPEDGITGTDVRKVRFALALRGYRMSDVDWTLDRLADELDRTRARLLAATGPAAEDGTSAEDRTGLLFAEAEADADAEPLGDIRTATEGPTGPLFADADPVPSASPGPGSSKQPGASAAESRLSDGQRPPASREGAPGVAAAGRSHEWHGAGAATPAYPVDRATAAHPSAGDEPASAPAPAPDSRSESQLFLHQPPHPPTTGIATGTGAPSDLSRTTPRTEI